MTGHPGGPHGGGARGVPARVIMLTPSLAGADGISAATRLMVGALASGEAWPKVAPTEPAQSDSPGRVSVWTLGEASPTPCRLPSVGVTYRWAAGNRARFVSWALRAAPRSHCATLVVVAHVQLAPAALPLIARGARGALILYGVEAWRRLPAAQRLLARCATTRIAISRHSAERFHAANPSCASLPIEICALALPSSGDETVPHAKGEGFALIVGRLAGGERYKGHDLLLELWPLITRDMPGATLVVAGDGDDRARLEAKAAALGLGGSVRFLGWVTDGHLRTLYRECAFFVMPSRGEGFGLVYLEAMRARKACIGGIGAPAEIIQHGLTGLIVDPDCPENVRSAVLRLFREPESRERMGAAGAERARTLFSEAMFRQRFLRALGLPREPTACAG